MIHLDFQRSFNLIPLNLSPKDWNTACPVMTTTATFSVEQVNSR